MSLSPGEAFHAHPNLTRICVGVAKKHPPFNGYEYDDIFQECFKYAMEIDSREDKLTDEQLTTLVHYRICSLRRNLYKRDLNGPKAR